MNNMNTMNNMNMILMSNMGMNSMNNINMIPMNNNMNINMMNNNINMQNQMLMLNNMQKMAMLFNNNKIPNFEINPGDNKITNDDDDNLVVLFRSSHIITKSEGNLYIAISCKYDEKGEEIIKRYRNKTGFKDRARFFYNAKNLNPSLTVAENGLNNNSCIFVVLIEEVCAGY